MYYNERIERPSKAKWEDCQYEDDRGNVFEISLNITCSNSLLSGLIEIDTKEDSCHYNFSKISCDTLVQTVSRKYYRLLKLDRLDIQDAIIDSLTRVITVHDDQCVADCLDFYERERRSFH